MAIYADVFLVYNLLMNTLILLCTSRLCGLAARLWRIFAAALFGAVYALFLPSVWLMNSFFLKAALGGAMLFFAFGKTGFFRNTVVFLLCGAGLGGLVHILSFESESSLLASPYTQSILIGGAAFIALMLLSGRVRTNLRLRTCECQIEIVTEKGKKTVRTFLDTGNRLCEPCSQKPVLLVQKSALESILPDAVTGGGTEAKARLYIVPYQSLGKEEGVLLGFAPISVSVRGKPVNCIVAVMEKPMLAPGYDAIINPIAL